MSDPGSERGWSDAVGHVAAIGEGLGHEPQAGVGGRGSHRLRRRQAEEREVTAEAGGGASDRGGQLRVRRCLVVERAVRLDVAQLDAGGAAERLERADLVADHRLDLVGLEVHRAATEAEQIGIARLRTDGDARASHRGRTVASMTRKSPAWKPQATLALLMWATSRSSSPRRPAAEALAEIGVEVHRRHRTAGDCRGA